VSDREAIDAIAELIAGSCPMWFTLRDSYCDRDRELADEAIRFVDELCRIVHPLRPDMVAAPLTDAEADRLTAALKEGP
jgi:hypothetical protein